MKILAPVVIVFGVTAVRDLIDKGHLRLSVVVGSFVLGVMLFGMQEVSSELAWAFAWVIALTAVMVNGPTVFAAVNGGMK